ncbi:MAG: nicotinamide-nucleotide amidase [Acidimicrobiaceae bacterium]|nr:nicotinamide-nucleotide amidase [Acidimicrobiaceae bacterium]
MRCEVVAIGTELLLGQIVDTNSSWLGERLAMAGIDSHFQTKVGDNRTRIVLAIRSALARSDAVIVCGGLGPTQDDITREAIAEVMNVPLVREPDVVEHIRALFASRGREMAESNARQADRPEGSMFIQNPRGTAPGLICPVGHKVVYAVPGVPYEMQTMAEQVIIPDLQERSGERAAIVSRTLRTWGLAESTLAERVAPRLEELDRTPGGPTIAFLASGIEGIKIRITAKAPTREEATALIEKEDAELRSLLGTLVFGVDDGTMEDAVGALLEERKSTLGLAESMTGGLVASRVVNVPGSSAWFKGSVVCYHSQVKFDLLGVPEGPVVSEEAALSMAEGAARVLKADVGLSVTGVAGPAAQDGQPVGTVWLGLFMDGKAEAHHLWLPGDRERIRQFAAISLMDLLRRRLLD